MPVPDHEPHLYVPRHANSRLAGLRLLHGVPDVRDVGWHGRTAITLRARTVYDCLRLLPALQATALLDRALQQGWIAVADLVDRIQRDTARRDLGKIVRVARGVVDGTRSAAERVTTDLLRRGGIGGGWRTSRFTTAADSSASATSSSRRSSWWWSWTDAPST
jgi:hypothetical protein